MGRTWTEDDVYNAIQNIITHTGQNYFPTHSEMNDFYNSRALSIQVSRKGGTRLWAKKFGLEIKKCESEFGNDYELIAMKDIKDNTQLDSCQTIPRYPYDLFINELVKIDVKAAKPLKDRNFNGWSFNLEKKKPTCDIFIFYCVDFSENIEKRVIIPSCAITGITQIGIGTLSKYDNYIERWDLISQYNNFYTDIKNNIPLIAKRRTTKGS